jgi:hypothetical protein
MTIQIQLRRDDCLKLMLYKLEERNSRNFAGSEIIGKRELDNLLLDGRSMA